MRPASLALISALILALGRPVQAAASPDLDGLLRAQARAVSRMVRAYGSCGGTVLVDDPATRAVTVEAGGSGEPPVLGVVRWTAEPVTSNNRADQLLTQGGAPWRVTERVASVIFGLAPDRAVPTAVVIDAAGLPDPPRAVEVLLGESERGPWRSVASFALEPGDTVRRQTIAPGRATFAMLRASGHQSGQATMALARFGMEWRPR